MNYHGNCCKSNQTSIGKHLTWLELIKLKKETEKQYQILKKAKIIFPCRIEQENKLKSKQKVENNLKSKTKAKKGGTQSQI